MKKDFDFDTVVMNGSLIIAALISIYLIVLYW